MPITVGIFGDLSLLSKYEELVGKSAYLAPVGRYSAYSNVRSDLSGIPEPHSATNRRIMGESVFRRSRSSKGILAFCRASKCEFELYSIPWSSHFFLNAFWPSSPCSAA